jgi:hypothetical protein
MSCVTCATPSQPLSPAPCPRLATQALPCPPPSHRSNNLMDTGRIQSEFPEILGIKESLIKYVFEPAAADRENVLKAVKEMRGR